MSSKWAAISLEVIRRAAAGSKGRTQVEVMRDVDAAYPFGERAYHPYQMWLKVRRAYIRERWGDGTPVDLTFAPVSARKKRIEAEVEFDRAKLDGLFQ